MTSATVHVIDDDELVRTALARLLRLAGYEVRSYASAGEFLLEPPPAAPGCLVLDVRMRVRAVSTSRMRWRAGRVRCPSSS